MTAKRNVAAKRFDAPRWMVPTLFALGAALTTWALVMLIQRWFFLAGATTQTLIGPGDDDLVSPLLILLFAAVPLFLGELFRRGNWFGADGSLARGGRVVVHLRQLPLGTVAAWALVPMAFWVALTPIPVIARNSGNGFPEQATDFWKFIGLWSFTSAAIFGTILGSLARRAAFTRAKRQGRVAPERWQGLWQVVSGGARAELMLISTGAGFLGIIPLVLTNTSATIWLAVIGATLLAGGLAMTMNAWRSGQEVGYAESVA